MVKFTFLLFRTVFGKKYWQMAQWQASPKSMSQCFSSPPAPMEKALVMMTSGNKSTKGWGGRPSKAPLPPRSRSGVVCVQLLLHLSFLFLPAPQPQSLRPLTTHTVVFLPQPKVNSGLVFFCEVYTHDHRGVGVIRWKATGLCFPLSVESWSELPNFLIAGFPQMRTRIISGIYLPDWPWVSDNALCWCSRRNTSVPSGYSDCLCQEDNRTNSQDGTVRHGASTVQIGSVRTVMRGVSASRNMSLYRRRTTWEIFYRECWQERKLPPL